MDFKKTFENIDKENVFLVVEDKIKERITILKNRFEIENKKLYTFKIITISELIDLLSFEVDKEAYLYNLEKFKRHLSITKEMFKFARYNFNNNNEKLNSFIKENEDYLIRNQYFIDNIEKYEFYVLGRDIFLKPFKEKYNLNLKSINQIYKGQPITLMFSTKEEELFYTFEEIAKLLDKKVDINDIYIANIDSSYYSIIRKISSFYKLPINLKPKETLYNIPYIKDILNKDYEEIIQLLTDEDFLHEKYLKERRDNTFEFDLNINKLVSILNDFQFKNYQSSAALKVIVDISKKISSAQSSEIYNAIKIIDTDEILALSDNAKVFILNATYESFPKIVKDNDLFSDKDKEEINYPVSSLVNLDNNNYLENIIKRKIVISISYPKKDNYKEYAPSDITLNLLSENQKPTTINLKDLTKSYALDYYKSFFSNKDENNLLQTTFKGDFKLTQNEKVELINTLRKKEIKINPSNIHTYYEIPFIYYLTQILKLDIFTETVKTKVGNFFHTIAEVLMLIVYNDKTNGEVEILKDKNLNQEIINYIDKNKGTKSIDINLYFDSFFKIYFSKELKEVEEIQNKKFSEDIKMIIKTLFYIRKNKDKILDALNFLTDFENKMESSQLLIEELIEVDSFKGKADLIKIYSDNKFSIIDYKASEKDPFNKNNMLELVDNLINDDDEISFKTLDLMQLILYGYALQKYDKNLEFRDVAYFPYLKKSKLNAMYVEENPDSKIYVDSTNRIIEKEKLEELFQKIDILLEKTLEKIYNFEFPIRIRKDSKEKQGREVDYYSKYEALAFYNNSELEEEIDED